LCRVAVAEPYNGDMVAAIRQHVTVQSGGVIEIRSTELVPGSEAEVIVLIHTARDVGAAGGLSSFIGAAKGLYPDVAAADRAIRDERDAWES
jgi:hypothetical protein